MKALGVLVAVLVLALPATAARPRILAPQDAWPVWSPDGRSIAFTRIDATGMTLEVLRLGGRPVAIGHNAFQLEPSWSPDGRALAFQAQGGIYVWRQAGGTVEGAVCGCGAPALGAELAYVRGTDLYVGGTRWATGVIGQAAWEPGGERLAFQRDDGVYVISGQNGIPGAPRRLAVAANPGRPVWSPEGSDLAYTAGGRVFVVSTHGSAPPAAVSPVFADIGTPSWSSGGDALAYTHRAAVEVTDLSGASSVLTSTSGLGAAFSPTGDAIAFAGPRPGCPGHTAIRLWLDNASNGPVTGSCIVRGTPRADVIEGTPLWGDVILAGAGSDQIHANDGHTDRVDCGPGRDVVWADRTDRLRGCEVVHR